MTNIFQACNLIPICIGTNILIPLHNTGLGIVATILLTTAIFRHINGHFL